MTDTHKACKSCEADGYCATYQLEHCVEDCGIVQRAESFEVDSRLNQRVTRKESRDDVLQIST